MMKNTSNRYEAPKAEVIAIESQGVLCTSAPGPSTTGNGGIQFNTTGGGW